MPTSRQLQTATRLQEFADFLRDEYLDPDHFDGWPDLPVPRKAWRIRDEVMPRADREGADLFLLGCSIDVNDRAWQAWLRAKRFLDSTVPPSDRQQVWHWVAGHSLQVWNDSRRRKGVGYQASSRAYDLHRYPDRHQRIYLVAEKIVMNYNGDPRTIWEKNEGVEVLRTLEEELQLGPEISRMTLGGLRDHKLVHMTSSPFKADRWVCKSMYALGLSLTTRPNHVAQAGNELFPDPWSVDGALWELGKDYEIKDLSDFERYYGEMATWKQIKPDVQELVRGMIDELSACLGVDNGWTLRYDPTHHWAGIYLVRTEGPLQREMEDIRECELWAWVGVGWYKTLVIAVDVGGQPAYFTDPVLDLCHSIINKKEEKQTSSGRWGMREFYADRLVKEADLLNREWLLENLTNHIKRVQRFVMAVEAEG